MQREGEVTKRSRLSPRDERKRQSRWGTAPIALAPEYDFEWYFDNGINGIRHLALAVH
jgi:hypothetical protein